MIASELIPFVPWQPLQVCAIPAPALALPRARFRRVSVVQATCRSRLARYRRGYRRVAIWQADRAANGTPQVEALGASLGGGEPDEANGERKEKQPHRGANPHGEPGIARSMAGHRRSLSGNLKSGHGRFVEKHKLRYRIAIVSDGQGQHEQRPYPKAVQGWREPARRIDRERKFKGWDGGGWPAMRRNQHAYQQAMPRKQEQSRRSRTR